MIKVIDNIGRIPVKFWTNPCELEESTAAQISHLANLPFAFHHIAPLVVIKG